MSVIAYREQQEQKVDVNNLWKWPKQLKALDSLSPNVPSIPEFGIWTVASDSGYRFGFGHLDRLCRFTENSVSGLRDSGYQAATFLDLQPGKYIMSFDADIDCRTYVVTYQYVGDGKVLRKRSSYKLFDAGHVRMEISVNQDEVCMFHFAGKKDIEWVTLTDIKIREGVL